MPLPTNGYRQPVTILDQNGNEVALIFDGTNYRLAVDISGGGGVLGAVELEDGGAGTTRSSIKGNGTAVGAAPNDGGLLVSGRDPTGLQRHIRVDAAGQLLAVATDATPGTVITTGANTPVGIGATAALPAIPANTRRMTVSVIGAAGSEVLIREVGGTAGTGMLLFRGGQQSYGGSDGAVAALEVENVGAVATTISIQFERD